MPREIIRGAAASDIPALGVLFQEVFGHLRDERIWKWKYFQNPRGTASQVCETDGRIVAHAGGTPVVMCDGAERYRALQSTDFMSSGRYAGGMGGGGVFARTARAFFEAQCGGAEGASMVYGFPGARHRALGERILGYSPVEPVTELRWTGAAGKPRMEPLLDLHLSMLASEPRFGAARDATYLYWRYVSHPLHRYSLVRSSRSVSRETSAIVRTVENGDLYLFEIGGSIEAGDLSRLATRLPTGSGAAVWWGSAGSALSSGLRAAGFTASERDHPVEMRFFRERAFPVPGEFHFSVGDYDVF